MKKQQIRRPALGVAIANGCGFKQNEPNDKGQREPNVWLQSFSPNYLPIKKDGETTGTNIKNDYRIAIFNFSTAKGSTSNYQVFKDMKTLEKSIAINGLDVGIHARLNK